MIVFNKNVFPQSDLETDLQNSSAMPPPQDVSGGSTPSTLSPTDGELSLADEFHKVLKLINFLID